MKQGIVWKMSAEGMSEDDRRYVAVGKRSDIEAGINPYAGIEAWLDENGVSRDHWSIFPLWDKKGTLGFYFKEPVSLDLIMRFKLTWA